MEWYTYYKHPWLEHKRSWPKISINEIPSVGKYVEFMLWNDNEMSQARTGVGYISWGIMVLAAKVI